MSVTDYQVVEELIRNDWQVLCRARQRGDTAPVLVKFPRRRPASLADLELLKHEFELLQGLSTPGVPKALALSEKEDSYSLVLEDCGGVPLDSVARSFPADLDKFFPLALQLCSILGELHRFNVIHRNVNPRSILVDAGSGSITRWSTSAWRRAPRVGCIIRWALLFRWARWLISLPSRPAG
jgi:serine/threonine protein kinase